MFPASIYDTKNVNAAPQVQEAFSRSEVPRSSLVFLPQLVALEYKNLVLMRRMWKTTLCQLLLPALCMLVLGIIQNATSTGGSVRFPPTTAIFASPDAVSQYPASDSGAIRSLPKCRVYDASGGRYGLGAPRPNAECVTLVYAPNTSTIVVDVMNRVAKTHGLIQDEDIMGFPTRAALDSYIAGHPGTVGSGVVFASPNLLLQVNLSTVLDESEATTIPIEVLYNKTVVGEFQSDLGDDEYYKKTRRSMHTVLVHRAVVEAILGVHSNQDKPSLSFEAKRFPELAENENSASIVDNLGGVFVYLGVMFSFVLTLRHMVAEKESNILDALRMTGLRESAYWLSFFIHFAVLCLIQSALMYAVAYASNSPTFVYVDGGIAFFTLYFYFLTMLCMAMCLSAFIPTTRAAILAGFAVLVIGLIFQFITSMMPIVLDLMYNPYQLPTPVLGALNLYPPLLYTRMDANFAWTIKKYVADDKSIQRARYTRADWDNGAYRFAGSEAEASATRNTDYVKEACFGNTTDPFAPLLEACHKHTASCDRVDNTYTTDCPQKKCTRSWSIQPGMTRERCEGQLGGVYVPHGENRTYMVYSPGSYVPSTYEYDASCECRYITMSDHEAFNTMIGLCFMYFVLAWYLGQVCTCGHGRSEPFYFPCLPWYWIPSMRPKRDHGGRFGRTRDPAALREEELIRSGQASDDRGVIVKGLVKIFGGAMGRGGFTAVDGLSFTMKEGECFALLGHNGAGKSTAIRMMNGLTSITEGDVVVSGLSAQDNMASVRELIGACPQHDILWPELSGPEHLYIFGMFQGMYGQSLANEVDRVLHAVRLKREGSNPASSFSGGMKRRLSVAIAGFGDKRIVVLDEPTTGMDPQNRSHVWRMISDLKKERVVLLTTHSMEEAEHLGDQIGIMSKGKLIALGDPLALKSKFGGGYRLRLMCRDTSMVGELESAILGFVASAHLLDVSAGSMTFDLPGGASDASLPALFQWIESEEGAKLVKDWSASQVGLEDIFIKLTKQDESGHGDVEVATPVVEARAAVAAVADAEPVVAARAEKEDLAGQEEESVPEAFVAVGGDNDLDDATLRDKYPSTDRSQFRALFLKDVRLMMRSRLLLMCQLLLPLILVLLVFVIKLVVEKELLSNLNNGGNNGQPSQFSPERQACDSCVRDITASYHQNLPYFENCRNNYPANETALQCPGYPIHLWKDANLATHTATAWDKWMDHVKEALRVQSLTDSFNVYDPENPNVWNYKVEAADLTLDNPVYAYCSTPQRLQAEPSSNCLRYAELLSGVTNREQATFFSGHFNERSGGDPVKILVSGSQASNLYPGVSAAALGSSCNGGNGRVLSYNDSLIFKTSSGRDPNGESECSVRRDSLQGPSLSTSAAAALQTGSRSRGCDIYTTDLDALSQAQVAQSAAQTGFWGYYPSVIVQTSDAVALLTPYYYNQNGENHTVAFSGLTDAQRVGGGVVATCNSYGFSQIATECGWRCNSDPVCCASYIALVRAATPSDSNHWLYFSGSQNSGSLDPKLVRFDLCASPRTALYNSPNFCPWSAFTLTAADAALPDGPAKVESFSFSSQEQVKLKRDWTTLVHPNTVDGMGAARSSMWQYFPDAAIIFKELDAAKARYQFTMQTYLTEWGGYSAVRTLVDGGSCGDRACPPRAQSPTLARAEWNRPYGRKDSPVAHEETIVLAGVATAAIRHATATGAAAPGSPFIGSPNVQFLLGQRPMDQAKEAENEASIIEIIASMTNTLTDILIPFATSMLLPVIAYNLVQEKELKLRATMSIMGLRVKIYFFARFIFDFIVVMTMLTLIYVLGFALSLDFFTKSKEGLMFVLFILWGLTMVSLAFFLQTFFSRTRTSNICLYLVVLVGVITSFILNSFVFTNSFVEAPPALMIWPPLTFYRGVSLGVRRSYFWSDLSPTEEFAKILGVLLLSIIVLLTLGLYLDAVLPKEYGVQRHPLFCCVEPARAAMRRRRRQLGQGPEGFDAALVDPEAGTGLPAILGEDAVEDPDIAQERKIVESSTADAHSVRVLHLRKVFGNGKVAVEDVSLHMEKNEIFTLLGPNGAGKSTLINMLTGMFRPTAGDATIDGHSILTDMQSIYEGLGVCMQFDTLWPSLTVLEHLLFFARLKGLPRGLDGVSARKAARAVRLHDALHKRANQLSGGMRRRLSLAISLVGAPRTVFMDEPTTGLDPHTRREIWKLIEQQKHERCIVLTTHSMEEAEALSSRVGIVAHGLLKAVGTSMHLKNKFGRGYRIQVSFARGNRAQAEAFVKSVCPAAIAVESGPTNATFEVAKESVALSSVFNAFISRDVEASGVVDWGCRQSSLEEVFLAIAQESERIYGTA